MGMFFVRVGHEAVVCLLCVCCCAVYRVCVVYSPRGAPRPSLSPLPFALSMADLQKKLWIKKKCTIERKKEGTP
jgi:hypothetical protein